MTRTLVIGLLAAAATGTAGIASRAAAQAPVEAAQGATAPAAAGAAGAAPQDARTALAPQGYTYRPGGRRDPFVTLIRRGSDASVTTAAGRAAGLAGLGTSEVALRGTLVSQGGYVGMLLGSDDRTYIVRPGDRLADGTIRTISADELVILQQVKDPRAGQTEREVRKALRQAEGTN